MIYKIRVILDAEEDIFRDLEIEAHNSLEDFHNAKKGEITFIKDPNHFKDILVNRQTMENYAN